MIDTITQTPKLGMEGIKNRQDITKKVDHITQTPKVATGSIKEEDELSSIIKDIAEKKQEIDDLVKELDQLRYQDDSMEIQSNIEAIVRLRQDIRSMEKDIKTLREFDEAKVLNQIVHLQENNSNKKQVMAHLNSNLGQISNTISETSLCHRDAKKIKRLLRLIQSLQREIARNQADIDMLFQTLKHEGSAQESSSEEFEMEEIPLQTSPSMVTAETGEDSIHQYILTIEKLKNIISEKELEMSKLTASILAKDKAEELAEKVKEHQAEIRTYEASIVDIVRKIPKKALRRRRSNDEITKYIEDIQRLAFENEKNQRAIDQIKAALAGSKDPQQKEELFAQMGLIKNRIKRNQIVMSTYSTVITLLPRKLLHPSSSFDPYDSELTDPNYQNAINILKLLIEHNTQRLEDMHQKAFTAQNVLKTSREFDETQSLMIATQKNIDQDLNDLLEYINQLPKKDSRISFYLREVKNLQKKSLEDVSKIKTILDVAKSLSAEELEYLPAHINATKDLQGQLSCYSQESKLVLNLVSHSLDGSFDYPNIVATTGSFSSNDSANPLERIKQYITHIYHDHSSFQSYQTYFMDLLASTTEAFVKKDANTLTEEIQRFGHIMKILHKYQTHDNRDTADTDAEINSLQSMVLYLQEKCKYNIEDSGQIIGKTAIIKPATDDSQDCSRQTCGEVDSRQLATDDRHVIGLEPIYSTWRGF